MQPVVGEEDQGRRVVGSEVEQEGVVEKIEPSESLRVVCEVFYLRVLSSEGDRVLVDVCGRGGFGQRVFWVLTYTRCILCVYSHELYCMCLFIRSVLYLPIYTWCIYS